MARKVPRHRRQKQPEQKDLNLEGVKIPEDMSVGKAYDFFEQKHKRNIDDVSRKFLIAWASENRPEIVSQLEKIKWSPALIYCGLDVEIQRRGATLSDVILESFETRLEEALQKAESDQDKPVVKRTRAPTRLPNLEIIESARDEMIMNAKTKIEWEKWIRETDFGPQIVKKMIEFYRPVFEEIRDAYNKKEPDLVEGYSGYTRKHLKALMEFYNQLIVALDAKANVIAMSSGRKPRKKKVKSATQLVEKLNYLDKDADLGLTSIKPENIIGAKILWVYNTKYRKLGVFHAANDAGLSVKGSTVIGFDSTTSICKKIRKPEQVVPGVVDHGKVALRKLLPGIRAKEQELKGRINKDTILMRALK